MLLKAINSMLKAFNVIFNLVAFFIVYLGLIWSDRIIGWLGYYSPVPVIASAFIAYNVVKYINRADNDRRTRKNQSQMERT